MRSLTWIAAGFCLVLLSGCAGTWSQSNVDYANAATEQRQPTEIMVVEGDITDRPYTVIQAVEVTVNKTTAFHPDPTQAQAKTKLQEAAAKIGADAVINAEYDPVSISFVSWGSLDARGTAVKFN